MKIGIIGCGGMGTTHYLALKALAAQADIEVVALADKLADRRERASSYWPQASIYEEGLDLLDAKQLDAVHICLPSYQHTEYAVAAMEKGIHVFIEKPVCLTPEDGELLLDVQKRTGVKVMVGHVVRFFEEYKYLKTVYDERKFGALKSLVLHRISGDVKWGIEDWFHDEKRSGSVVLDLHIHDVDFLRYMLGEPDSFRVMATEFETGMINQIITNFQFGNIFVVAEGSWNVSRSIPFQPGFRASFEKATVIFDVKAESPLTTYHKDGTVEFIEIVRECDMVDGDAGINVSHLGPYYSEIKYFINCIKNDESIEIAPLAEGVNSVKLALDEWKKAKEYVMKIK